MENTEMTEGEQLKSTREVALTIGTSAKTVLRLAKRKGVAGRRLGLHRRWSRDDVTALLAVEEKKPADVPASEPKPG